VVPLPTGFVGTCDDELLDAGKGTSSLVPLGLDLDCGFKPLRIAVLDLGRIG